MTKTASLSMVDPLGSGIWLDIGDEPLPEQDGLVLAIAQRRSSIPQAVATELAEIDDQFDVETEEGTVRRLISNNIG
jgi:hypothetical protein